MITILEIKDCLIKSCEAVSVFQLASNYKRGKKKMGTVTVQLPDDWILEMMQHVGGFGKAEHNYLLVRVPIDGEVK